MKQNLTAEAIFVGLVHSNPCTFEICVFVCVLIQFLYLRNLLTANWEWRRESTILVSVASMAPRPPPTTPCKKTSLKQSFIARGLASVIGKKQETKRSKFSLTDGCLFVLFQLQVLLWRQLKEGESSKKEFETKARDSASVTDSTSLTFVRHFVERCSLHTKSLRH